MIKKINNPEADHRWFIWTIVFLIVSGVSLVSYIMITEIEQETMLSDSIYVTPQRQSAPASAVQ